MPWYFGTVIGATCLAVVQYVCKSRPIDFGSQAIITIPLILCNLGFWYGFQNSTNFLKTYYTGSALNLIAGFGLSMLVFDKSISPTSLAGVGLIVVGQQLLVR